MCLGGVSTADLSLTTHPHEHDHHRAAGGHPAGFCCSPRVRAGSVMDIRRGPDVKRARSGRAGLSHHMGPGGVTTPDTKPMRIGAQEFLRAARRARGCPILRWKRAMTLGTPRVCGLPRQSPPPRPARRLGLCLVRQQAVSSRCAASTCPGSLSRSPTASACQSGGEAGMAAPWPRSAPQPKSRLEPTQPD